MEGVRRVRVNETPFIQATRRRCSSSEPLLALPSPSSPPVLLPYPAQTLFHIGTTTNHTNQPGKPRGEPTTQMRTSSEPAFPFQLVDLACNCLHITILIHKNMGKSHT